MKNSLISWHTHTHTHVNVKDYVKSMTCQIKQQYDKQFNYVQINDIFQATVMYLYRNILQ